MKLYANRKLFILVLWQYVPWILCPLYVCDDINICFLINFSYTLGPTSIFVNQPSKHFKNCCFNHENPESSVDKNAISNGFRSRVKAVVRLRFIPYIKNLINIFGVQWLEAILKVKPTCKTIIKLLLKVQ